MSINDIWSRIVLCRECFLKRSPDCDTLAAFHFQRDIRYRPFPYSCSVVDLRAQGTTPLTAMSFVVILSMNTPVSETLVDIEQDAALECGAVAGDILSRSRCGWSACSVGPRFRKSTRMVSFKESAFSSLAEKIAQAWKTALPLVVFFVLGAGCWRSNTKSNKFWSECHKVHSGMVGVHHVFAWSEYTMRLTRLSNIGRRNHPGCYQSHGCMHTHICKHAF